MPIFPRERCDTCAAPLAGGGTCGACLKRPPAFDSIIPAWPYLRPVDALILALKFSGRLAAAAPMTRALSGSVDGTEAPDLIVPLPLSMQRLAERGFNQALEIARPLAEEIAIPMDPTLLTRSRHTHPQSQLPWKERARNVRGAFQCESDLSGIHVALVDDVLTTGSTLHEAAQALKRRGAARVSGWVVARTVPRAL
jgi:ComF family protein